MIKLDNIKEQLSCYNKVIVTGPIRAGTTISAKIIAHELGYKFIDESWYDGNNQTKFLNLFRINRKMVIHTTAFLRDLHTVASLLDLGNIPVVLVKRDIKDILESYENTKKFTVSVMCEKGLYINIDEHAKSEILKHYGHEEGCIPEITYNHFYTYVYKFNKEKLFYINYKDLKNHKLFIKKEDRRKNFVHIKQVDNDPNNLRGIMVI